ncbi:MAG TPA: DNA translocase FtsK [Burkholderiaceae bacterium]|nr:DNA translocase FtsK [Burkholderiaceae bacterium]
MPPDDKKANHERAKTLVIQAQNPSTAFLQRSLRLGYGAATTLMVSLEADGVVTSPDEHGYRRLTPLFEKTATEVLNNWRIFPDDEDAPLEGELIDVSGAVAAVRPYSPSHVGFYPESGLPWIEVTFPEVTTPATVISMGLELEHVLQHPVYLANLQLRKVEYLVEGTFLLGHWPSYGEDHFKSVRVPLIELGRIWNIVTPATGSFPT